MSTPTPIPDSDYRTALLNRVQGIYQGLPTVACKRLCGECCGPIAMYAAEAEIITAAGHNLPRCNERTMTCTALKNGDRCSIYDVRPFVCRIWGAIRKLQCPHGCEPAQWLSDKDVFAMMRELRGITIEIYGDDRIYTTLVNIELPEDSHP